jgi:DNA-directed RNA polymerase specialized sigma24 family protein
MPRTHPIDTAHHAYLRHRRPDPLYQAILTSAERQAARKCPAHVAEDIASLVAEQVWLQAATSLAASTKLSGYVATITRRRIADYHRGEAKLPVIDWLGGDELTTANLGYQPDIELSDRDLDLVNWRDEGYTYREIAAFTGVAESTLRKNFSRLRGKTLVASSQSGPSLTTNRVERVKPPTAAHAAESLVMGQPTIERNAAGDTAAAVLVAAWQGKFTVVLADLVSLDTFTW